MHRNVRHLLLGSSSLVAAFGMSFGAQAQQDVLETVIVTAEKQATDIQKTSVSVTAIQLDGMPDNGKTKITDLLANVAGVALQSASRGNTIPVIRGLVVSQGEAVVSQVDNVATLRTGLQYVGMFDVSRVEVLRGPQGTLYGRNAEMGAVNLYTNNPTDKYEGRVTVGAGDYNLVQSDGMVNIPLADDMAMRFAFSSVQRTGYGHPEGTGNEDYASVRGKFQYKPTENLRVVLSGTFTNFAFFGTYDIIPTRTKIANFASPAFGGFNPCGGNPSIHEGDPFHSPPSYSGVFSCTVPAQLPVNPNPVTGVCQRVQRSEENFGREQLTVDYDMGWAGLYLNAAHDEDHFVLNHLSQGSTNGLNSARWNPFNQNVAEMRLSNPVGQDWRWVGGAYWEQTHELANSNNKDGTPNPRPTTVADTKAGMLAFYGQTTIPVTDRFRVIGGVRWALDHLDVQARSQDVLNHNVLIGGLANGSFKWPRLTYKAGVEIDVAEQSMLFATVSTGFRQAQVQSTNFCKSNTTGLQVAAAPVTSGGGCLAGSTSTAFFTTGDPDAVTNYEVGSKNRFLDNRLEVNIDGFYYNLASFGNTGFAVGPDNRNASAVVSIKGSKGYGSELETSLLLTPNDRIDIALAYLKTEVGPDNPFQYPVCFNWGSASTHATAINITPTVDPVTLKAVVNTANLAACNAKNLAANPATVNWVRYRSGLAEGDTFSNAPTWNGNVSYAHIFDLESGATVTAKATVHFQSTTNGNIQPYYDGVNPAFHMTDFQLAYDTADGKWSMSAWVRNIENHLWIQGAGQSGANYVYQFLGAPRTWGVNLTARF